MDVRTQDQSYSEKLADFVVNLRFDQIPSEVVSRAKTHLLDSVGVAVAGSAMPWCQQANRIFQQWGGPPEATVMGQGDRIAVANAAIANGIAIAAIDFDDTDYTGGGGHMSRSVIASALAMGEKAHHSGKEVLCAIVAGYEVASRVGAALMLDRYGPRAAKASWGSKELDAHHRMQLGALVRGFIPGLFASAAIAGRLLGLNAMQLVAAQGLVGGLGSFLGQTHREGADGLFLHAGWAAHAGVIAAHWAHEGLIGPRQIYEGDRGLLAVIGGELQDPPALAKGLGNEWNTLNNLLKFHPSGHGTHHFIESLKGLIQEHKVRPENIVQIECLAPAQRIEYHFEPREAKLHPTPYNARFSLPYMLARLATDGKLGPLGFMQEKVSEPKVLELAERVTYKADESAWFGEKKGLVTVTLRDGRKFSRSSPKLLGFPDRPYTREDVLLKFNGNAKLMIGDLHRVRALSDQLEAFETVEDIASLMRLTAK